MCWKFGMYILLSWRTRKADQHWSSWAIFDATNVTKVSLEPETVSIVRENSDVCLPIKSPVSGQSVHVLGKCLRIQADRGEVSSATWHRQKAHSFPSTLICENIWFHVCATTLTISECTKYLFFLCLDIPQVDLVKFLSVAGASLWCLLLQKYFFVCRLYQIEMRSCQNKADDFHDGLFFVFNCTFVCTFWMIWKETLGIGSLWERTQPSDKYLYMFWQHFPGLCSTLSVPKPSQTAASQILNAMRNMGFDAGKVTSRKASRFSPPVIDSLRQLFVRQ